MLIFGLREVHIPIRIADVSLPLICLVLFQNVFRHKHNLIIRKLYNDFDLRKFLII